MNIRSDAVAASAVVGVPGGVERALGLAEVTTVLLLAWWAVRASRTQ